MHNGVIGRLALPLRYVGVDLPPGFLPDFLRIVRAGNFLGGNVTIPFKEEAAALADDRSEAVSVCGAANVIRVTRGRLVAENTDGWVRRFRMVVILGGGGAARGIAYELCRCGARDMVILNRNPARAERFARSLSPRFPATSISAGELETACMAEAFRGADLIAQCTSLGLSEEWDNFPVGGVEKTTRFADVVYLKGGGTLVRRLGRRGVPVIDGLAMLAHQAARSFSLWTGIKVPAGEFLSIAEKQLRSDP
jgi:shikimate dehydrogenase